MEHEGEEEKRQRAQQDGRKKSAELPNAVPLEGIAQQSHDSRSSAARFIQWASALEDDGLATFEWVLGRQAIPVGRRWNCRTRDWPRWAPSSGAVVVVSKRAWLAARLLVSSPGTRDGSTGRVSSAEQQLAAESSVPVGGRVRSRDGGRGEVSRGLETSPPITAIFA
jgi:hypothetical protein